MPKQKPQLLIYAALAAAVVGVLLIVIGLSLPDWIIVSGRDSVAKTRDKIKTKSNVSVDEWLEKWPKHQVQYDAMNKQKAQLFAAIGQMKQGIQTANASLGQLMMQRTGGSPQAAAGIQPLVAKIKALGEQLVTQGGNLRKVMMGMGKLEAMNASLTALDDMRDLNMEGGFFKICTKHPTAGRCGSPASFRNESLDEICDPDYNSSVIPTKDSVLLKTLNCNANGLGSAMIKSSGFFSALIIIGFALGILVTVLLLTSFLAEMPDNCLFTSAFMGAIYILAGILPLVTAIVFNLQVVGGYRKQGMVRTFMGVSGIMCIVGGTLLIVVGLLLVALHLKKSEVSPADKE